MARKKSSVSVAASAAGRPAERLAKKKMAERISELRRADFQFQRLKRVDRGSRNRRRKTAPTGRSVFCAEGGILRPLKAHELRARSKRSAVECKMRQLHLRKHSGAFKIWSIVCNKHPVG